MDNMARDKKETIISKSKIALGLILALTTQGYTEDASAETAVSSSNKNDMVLDKLKVEETSHAQEGDWVYDEIHSVSEISREQMDGYVGKGCW